MTYTIKNQGLNNMFLHKTKHLNFRVGMKLLVPEYQEVVFCRNQECFDMFTTGEHSLDEDNFPLLTEELVAENQIIKNGELVNCNIYFVNKGFSANIVWGNGVPINVLSNENGQSYSLRINGDINLRVADSKIFLSDVLNKYGNFDKFDQSMYDKNIRKIILDKIREHIDGVLSKMNATADELVNQLNEINPRIRKILAAQMKKFGLEIVGFSIEQFVLMKNVQFVNNNVMNYNVYPQMQQSQQLTQQMTSYVPPVVEDDYDESTVLLDMQMAPASFNENNNEVNIEQNAIKYCSECGSKNVSHAKFCTVCGGKF